MLPFLVVYDLQAMLLLLYCQHTVEKLSTNLYFFLSTLDLMDKAKMGDDKHDSEVCVVTTQSVFLVVVFFRAFRGKFPRAP